MHWPGRDQRLQLVSQMNAFDFSILSFLNRFAGQYLSFDKALVFLCNNGFFRGGVIAALCWWAWFKNGEDKDKNKEAREVIISTMLACLVSVLFARLVVLAFPFRVRPISDPTNGFHFPAAPIDWHNWSSFPSDHAIMFFTLTTGLFFISRVLGWIALMDSVFLVCLPRIYLGVSWPIKKPSKVMLQIELSCGSKKVPAHFMQYFSCSCIKSL
ncbi:MAG: hypothetical protein DME26_09070 [Verrucomicrobia bacterium]|nr:MAG: hypothetical protein DME26_09070 [Verrucomicrobiota bacterium]